MTASNFIFAAAGGDSTPDAFNFTDQTGVELNTVITSNSLTITGITGVVNVSVTGGTVSINGGAYVSSGTIQNNQTVTLRLTSSGSFSTQVSATLTIGDVSDTWFVTTRAADTTGTMVFTDVTSAELNTVITSTTTTASLFEPNYTFTITCTGGTIDTGTTSLSGTFASSKSVTTSGTGTFVIAVRLTSHPFPQFSTLKVATITAGNTVSYFNVTTRPADTVPDPFSFTSTVDSGLNTINTSNTVTITGLEPNHTINVTVSGSQVSVDAGTTTLSGSFSASKNNITVSASGTIVVATRIQSSTSYNTAAVSTVTIGGVNGTYTVTTRDVVPPGAFSFTNISNVEINTVTTSGTITITGMDVNAPYTVSATNGTVDAGTSVLSGTFASSKSVTTSGTGTFVIAARATSSSSFNTAVTVTVTIRGVSSNFIITTRAADTTGVMTFVDQTNINPSTQVDSTTITASQFEPNYTFTVSCTGGTIDAGTTTLSGTFATSKSVTTSGTGTFVIAARTTSSSSFLTGVNVVVTAGNTSDTFTVTTRAADTVGNMVLVDQTGLERSVVVTSSTITASLFEPNYTFTITASGNGGTIDAGTTALSGTFATSKSVTTSGTGTFVIAARVTSSASLETTLSVLITAGVTTDLWSVSTRMPDLTPDPYSFPTTNTANPGQLTVSDTITISGLEPNYPHDISLMDGVSPLVDAGTSTLSGTFAATKTVNASATGTLVVAVRDTAPSTFSTSNIPVYVFVSGGGTGTWTLGTRAADTVGTMVFADQSNVQLSTVTTSTTITASQFEPNYTFTVSCTGGTIDVGTTTLSGTFATSKSVTTSGTGTFVIAARVTSSASVSTPVNCVVTAGSTSDTFTVTTRAEDPQPDPFSFASASGVEPSSTNTSSQITITGLEPNFTFTISASNGLVDAGTTALSGTYAASKSITTSGSGSLVVAARVTASSSFNTSNTVTITVGTGSGTYTATTRAADTLGSMVFVDQTGVSLSTVTTSSTITATQFEPNYTFTITCTGGTIDAGTSTLSGTFATSKTITTSGTGTFVIAARGTSSSTPSTNVDVIVTAGNTSDTFTITTRAPLSPNAFSFTEITGVEPNTVVTSSTITVTGLDPNYSYYVYTTSGSVSAGTTTISGTYNTGQYATSTASGTIVVSARVTSYNGLDNIGSSAVVYIQGVSAFFTVRVRYADTTPNSFSIPSSTGVERSTVTTSNEFTIGGLEPSYSSITVTAAGGTIDVSTTSGSGYSGTYAASKSVATNASGQIFVKARGTSNANFSVTENVTVICGGVSSSYSITTRAADTTPNAFSINPTTGVNASSIATSTEFILSGLEPSYPITVTATNGTIDVSTVSGTGYSGTAGTSKTGTTNSSGQLYVVANGTASASLSTTVTVTVTCGGVSANYNITTRDPDTTPNAFSFTDALLVNPSTAVDSGTLTISGLEPNTVISFSNAFSGFPAGYFVQWGTSTLGGLNTVTNGMGFAVTTSGSGSFLLKLSTTSPGTLSTAQSGTVILNSVSDTWNISTRDPDITGSFPAVFTYVTNAERSTLYTSTAQTASGFEPNTSLTFTSSGGEITGGTSAVDGVWSTSKTITTSASGTVVINARMTSSPNFSTGTATSIYCNGTFITNGNFGTTTRSADLEGVMSFTDVSGATTNTTYTSATVTATGFEPSWTVYISCTGGLVDAGTTSLSGTFASTKTVTTTASGTFVIAARVTSSSSDLTSVNCVVTAGNTVDTYTVTTAGTPETITYSLAASSNPGSGVGSNGQAGNQSSATFRGTTIVANGGGGGLASGAGGAGGTWSGGDGGSNGGSGGTAGGDVGGGGGGGIGSAGGNGTGGSGYGGNGGIFSADPNGIKAELTALGVGYQTVAASGADNTSTNSGSKNGSAAYTRGGGGGGAGWYGGDGGYAGPSGGGGGAAGYPSISHTGGGGGWGWMVIKYTNGGTVYRSSIQTGTSTTIPGGSSNITIWVAGGGGGGAGTGTTDPESGGGGGGGAIVYKTWA